MSFQALFARALSTPGDDFGGQRGFAVYRNTSAKAVLDALRANYPVVLRLLGQSEFDRLALAYAQRCPPTSPVLADYGARFADSYTDFDADRPFIPDVARIDRLWTEAHCASDAFPMSADAIVSLAHDRLMSRRISVHPASRYRWFEMPAPSIWIAHRDDVSLSEIAVDWQPEGILLTRISGVVAWHRVDAEMLELLDLFSSGATAPLRAGHPEPSR